MNAQKKVSQAPRLAAFYKEKLKPQLKDTLKLSNIMQVPKLEKIVLNLGVKEAVADSRVLNNIMTTIDNITGQKSVKTYARKSIAGFKIREGMPLGVMVTLRNDRMYEFLDKLINLALPRVRDFQGVSKKLDGQGNYNMGVKEWIIFPEADVNNEKVFGLNITFHTSTTNDAHALELLKGFGMPFKKS